MATENNKDVLPDGWVQTTLGEVTTPTHIIMRPNESTNLPYIGLEHIESETMKLLGTQPASELKSSAKHFQPGDVLYGRLRPYLNKVYRPDFEGLCSSEFLIFPKSSNLSSRYLQYFLNSWSFKEFASHLVTGDRPRVDWNQLKDFVFPLPPLSEQRRVVSAIEQQFTRLDAGVVALQHAKAKLKRCRAALLKSAVEGSLTAAWRTDHPNAEPAAILLDRILKERRTRWEADQLAKMQARGVTPKDDSWKKKYIEPQAPHIAALQELPEGWCWANLGQIASFQNGRPFPSKEYTSLGVKLLRPGNLYADGSVQWTNANTRYLPEIWAERNQDLIILGRELTMNLTAQSLKDEFLGRVCITSEGERCLLNQRLARIIPFVDINRYYILYMLKSSVFRRFVDGLNTGSLIQHMFTSQLDGFSFPLPPLAEQQQIVAEVERRLSIISEVEATIETNLKRADRLRQTILREAFAGCLVPQNPNDEPASVLLQRIHEERAQREQEEQQRRKGGRVKQLPGQWLNV